jgi:hypothetical protein
MNKKENDPGRNRPSDVGKNNDPNLRDESAHQPGVSTMSSSDTDYLNEETSESVSNDPGVWNNQNTSDFNDDLKADPAFDEVNDAES